MNSATLVVLSVVVLIIVLIAVKKNKNKPHEITEEEKRIIEHNKAVQLKYVDIAGNPNLKHSQLIEIAGVHIDNRRLACMKCQKGEELMLVPDEENKSDKNAVQVKSFRGHMLGFIPAPLAADIAPQIEKGIVYRAFYSHHEYVGAYFYAYINLNEYQP